MYFNQNDIQCWKDLCEKQRHELKVLREERRFKAAKGIAAGMFANPEIANANGVTWNIPMDAVIQADILLAELDKKKEEA